MNPGCFHPDGHIACLHPSSHVIFLKSDVVTIKPPSCLKSICVTFVLYYITSTICFHLGRNLALTYSIALSTAVLIRQKGVCT